MMLRYDVSRDRVDNDFEFFYVLRSKTNLKIREILSKSEKCSENGRIADNLYEIHLKYHMRLWTNPIRGREDDDFEIFYR